MRHPTPIVSQRHRATLRPQCQPKPCSEGDGGAWQSQQLVLTVKMTARKCFWAKAFAISCREYTKKRERYNPSPPGEGEEARRDVGSLQASLSQPCPLVRQLTTLCPGQRRGKPGTGAQDVPTGGQLWWHTGAPPMPRAHLTPRSRGAPQPLFQAPSVEPIHGWPPCPTKAMQQHMVQAGAQRETRVAGTTQPSREAAAQPGAWAEQGGRPDLPWHRLYLQYRAGLAG